VTVGRHAGKREHHCPKCNETFTLKGNTHNKKYCYKCRDPTVNNLEEKRLHQRQHYQKHKPTILANLRVKRAQKRLETAVL